MKTIKIATFLSERKIKMKPTEANKSGLQRIEKIDFDGNIYLAPIQTNTDMITVKKGDLVISGINVEKGALAIYHGEEDVLTSIHYSAYEFDETQIDIIYLKWFLKSRIFKKLLLEQTGSGIKKEIKAKHLLPIEIELPSLKVQQEIVSKILSVEHDISFLEREITRQEKYVFSLRQSILQQAVEGKLCEQDPMDEPASVLLGKIKAEKEKLIAEKKIKKQKELPPITEEEQPFDLPHGWEWCRLGDISNYITDGKHGDCTDQENSGYFFISAKDIVNGRIIYRDARQIAKSDFIEVHQRTNLEPNDILVPNTGASIGKIAITQENEKTRKTTFQKSVAIIKYNDSQMYPTYLCNAILIEVNKIQKTLKGTAMVNLLLSEIRNFIIPLPPLAEQQRIVEKVNRLMLLCDELEQEVLSARKYASQLMEAVLQEAFSNNKEKTTDNVIVFTPTQKPASESLLAAARGNMREETWENLRARALELASEGS